MRNGFRRALFALSIAAVGLLTSAAGKSTSGSEPVERWLPCASVRPAEPIRLGGRALQDRPDITAMPLKLANALIDSGCVKEASVLMEEYSARSPNDVTADLIEARLAAIDQDTERAKGILEWLLEQKPDLSSARIVQAQIAIEENRLDDAERALTLAARSSPDDLWLFMENQALVALRAPGPKLQAQLNGILADRRFPGGARDRAAELLGRMPGLSAREWESIELARLNFDSITPLWAKAIRIGRQLIDGRLIDGQTPDYAETRRILVRHACQCEAGRTLLATTYLLEAATISPQPASTNMALVDKALKALDGDLSPVALSLVGRPYLAPLLPFVAGQSDPNAVDQWGRNALCNAIMFADAEAAARALDGGVDRNTKCNDRSPVDYMMMLGITTRIPQHQSVLRVLLDHGLRPGPGRMTSCMDPANGSCLKILGPVLHEYID